MRRTIAALLVCWSALAWGAAGRSPEGRWEGRIEIPGNELPLILDLARGSGGVWAGSIIIPGLGIKGAPLSNVVVTDTDVSFDLGNVLGSPTSGATSFSAYLTGDGMAGEMRQAGNTASFSLRKVGPAQVELPPRSTPVMRNLEDKWSGEFDLGGYPRQVTITLENHSGTGATARFVVVGKRTTDLQVDLVIQEGNFLRIESQANQVSFEGRVLNEGGEIRGTIELGSIELPLVLHRSSGRAS